jgi:M6 family metalloprotease-like protein
MRKVIIILLTALFPLCISAQEELTVVRGGCLLDGLDATGHRVGQRRLPTPKDNWDPGRIYRQLVILVEFSDTEFSYTDDAHTFYERVFNESGFNGDKGRGCVADYYRDQSQGLCNLYFDVYGPYKTSGKAQPYDSPTKDTKNHGKDVLVEATNMMLEANPDIDLSVYDWDGNKSIEQVIYVYAGYPGNVGSASYGHIWPNTGSFSAITTATGYKISNYTCSGELWPTGTLRSCGIGTICHEFTHSLGLPDIYPTSSSAGYSTCDEWDLMDGGNFTNYGWCPPNFTPLEKMLLGWLTPTDLTEPTTITDLQPSSEGGEVYRIMHSDSEWLLLENRQQSGWDLGAPGKGLVIYHVNYDGSAWRGNSVNNDPEKRRFYLVPADNMDYDAWDDYIDEKKWSTYANNLRMNNRHLSTSPYPYVLEGEVLNNELTDTSTPAAAMYYPEGALLDKPITNIRMSEEGLVSFDFMGGDPSGIKEMQASSFKVQECYDLQGRRVMNPQQGNLYIVRTPQGTRKQLY